MSACRAAPTARHLTASLALCLALAALTTGAVAAAEATDGATVLRTATLYASDDFASEQLGEFAAGTRLAVYSRRGLWLEVDDASDGGEHGYVRLTSVRMSGALPGNETPGSGLARLSRSIAGLLGGFGRREQPKAYDTVGIRGLTPGELETAAFDASALAAVSAASADRVAARAFADAGGLVAREVEKLADSDPRGGKTR